MPRTIATTTTVDRDAMLDFVRPRHHHILMTQRADGAPQASPVTAGVDAEGRIVISSYPERAKIANLRRRPECSVLVLSDATADPEPEVHTFLTERIFPRQADVVTVAELEALLSA